MAAKFDLKNFQPKKASEAKKPRSFLIFGPSKRGKSVLAASIVDVPGFERVLLIDVEGGAASISEWYPEVDVIEVNTAPDFDGVIEALVNGTLVEPESGLPYQAVIIDTLDKAFDRKLDWADKQPEAIAAQSGKKDHFYKWAVVKAWMLKISDMTHMAPFFTVFVAHVMDDVNEDTGKRLQTVALGGASKYTFSATPDIVGYFDITKEVVNGKKVPTRTIDFRMDDRRITGQRYSSKLDGIMQEPTMEKIFRAIQPGLFK